MKLTNDLYQHAISTVPYYQELKSKNSRMPIEIRDFSDFRNIPLLSQQSLQEYQNELISRPYLRYPLNSKLTIRRSLGIHGYYYKLYWHEDNGIRSQEELWSLRKNNFNISKTDKHAYFYTTKYITNTWVEPQAMELSADKTSIGFCARNLSDERMLEIYQHLCEFQPAWILMSPSIAQLLVDYVSLMKLPAIPNLMYIECMGEYLDNTLYSRIVSVMGCPVGFQYGCPEANAIAFLDHKENRINRLRCLKTNVYVETLENGEPVSDGESGDVYITVLTNFAMPLIRFETGQRGILHKETSATDDCQVLELLPPQTQKFVCGINDERIPTSTFRYPIEYINERIGNIIQQFQVTQQNKSEFLIKMYIRQSYFNWRDVISDEFRKAMQERALEGVAWRFQYYDKPIE